MSLGCGNCRRFNLDGYGYYLLYLLEPENGKLDYIDEFNRHVSPNSALCEECVGEAFKLGKKDAAGLTSGYALVTASSGGGRAQWSDVTTDRKSARYFDDATAKSRWPKALEIIDGMPRLLPSPENAEFVERLLNFLRDGDRRFHVMAELAPGAVITWDNHGDNNGELDIYFDLARWKPTSPEIWGDSLTPPEFKRLGIGVLSEKCYGRPPKNFVEFRHLARQTLVTRLSSVAWYDDFRRFKFPRELEA